MPIVSDSSLQNMVFELIETAESQGWDTDLYEGLSCSKSTP